MNTEDVPSSTNPADPAAPVAPASTEIVAPAEPVGPELPFPFGILRREPWLEPIVAVALLAFFAICGLRFAWTTSPVFDEPFFLQAGYTNLTAGAAKAPTANLIFAQNWVSLPLLFTKPSIPTERDIAAVEPINREVGRMFVFYPKNDWRAMLDAARPMNILLGLGICMLVWRWSRKLFGPAGGLSSLAFCCFSPLMIANSAVATTDIAVTLWFAVAVHRVWKLLHGVSPFNVLACGAAAGLLLVTKISALLLGPIAFTLLVFRLVVNRPLDVGRGEKSARQVIDRVDQLKWLLPASGAAILVAVGVMWLCYLPQITIFAPHTAAPYPWAAFGSKPTGMLSTLATAMNRWHVLPEPYLFDLRLFEVTTSVRRAYLMGDYALGGWWYFFPLAWWFKTPIPFMVALALGAGVLLGRRLTALLHPDLPPAPDGAHALYELTPLALFAVVYLGGTLSSGLNIGVRHILPVYPALFILSGAAVLGVSSTWRLRTVSFVVLWGLFEVVRVAPDYLAYCNTFAGGTEDGHRVLVDSSYEWGQDLPAVEKWVAARAQTPGEKRPVYFSYFGNADLKRFKLPGVVLLPQFYDLRPISPYPLGAGTYIISATQLHTIYGPAMGPWRPSYEARYQTLTGEMRRLESQMGDVAKAMEMVKREGEAQWTQKVRDYDFLRFARLCAYLRKRLPDARITAGMLVYELTLDELERALIGPPTELKLDYQIKGTENIPQEQLDFYK